MLSQGRPIIEMSHLEFTSQLVIVPQKDGRIRICLDAREINKALITDRTSPEGIDGLIKTFL